jgi:4-amino-4-deoxy-L-arabinose transferase-like glycosyltransferase
MNDKWFGREPTVVIATIASVLALLAGFGIPGLNDTLIGALTAFLTAGAAAFTAWYVRPITPALFTGLITTGATLVATFGLNLSQAQVSLVTASAIAVMTLFTRAQVTPISDPKPIT